MQMTEVKSRKWEKRQEVWVLWETGEMVPFQMEVWLFLYKV